jgi:hypothetical protein
MDLIDITNGHKEIIEDQRSDTTTKKKKMAAWEDVSRKMKAVFPERTGAQSTTVQPEEVHGSFSWVFVSPLR